MMVASRRWVCAALVGCGLGLGLTFVTSAARAQSTGEAAVTNSIEHIDSTQTGVGVFLRIQLKGAVAIAPSSFSVSFPPRIVLDLMSTVNNLGRNAVEVNQGGLRSVNIVQAQGRSRIVLNLRRPVTYAVTTKGNVVQVALGEIGEALTSPAAAAAAAPPAPTAPVAAAAAGAGTAAAAAGAGTAVAAAGAGTAARVASAGTAAAATGAGTAAQATSGGTPGAAVASGGTAAAAAGAGTAAAAAPSSESASAEPQTVGQAPESSNRPPQVAAIFEQPGILTPKGKFVLEPSAQYSYTSSNQVTLVGYTIIPAITVGLINVQEVKSNSATGTLTGRYGITNRWEVELRVPYVYRWESVVALPTNTGSSTSLPQVNSVSGSHLGDIEGTVRYQFTNGGVDEPYYVGSLRFKSRTGLDPFQVTTLENVSGFNGIALQSELPTGSGFYAVQPGLSVLLPSDPAVLFGGLSYLYNFKRDSVTENTNSGPVNLYDVVAGNIFTLNIGMGVALNSKASFSLGYEQDSLGPTVIDGTTLAGSTRIELATLLLGFSYRRDDRSTVVVTVGAGLTRDTPDITVTLRWPVMF